MGMPHTNRQQAPLTWLRLAREMRGWTQTELGDRVQMTQAQISRLEGGQRQPRHVTVQRLARALDVDPHKLFSEDGPTPHDVIAAFLCFNGGKKRRTKR